MQSILLMNHLTIYFQFILKCVYFTKRRSKTYEQNYLSSLDIFAILTSHNHQLFLYKQCLVYSVKEAFFCIY